MAGNSETCHTAGAKIADPQNTKCAVSMEQVEAINTDRRFLAPKAKYLTPISLDHFKRFTDERHVVLRFMDNECSGSKCPAYGADDKGLAKKLVSEVYGADSRYLRSLVFQAACEDFSPQRCNSAAATYYYRVRPGSAMDLFEIFASKSHNAKGAKNNGLFAIIQFKCTLSKAKKCERKDGELDWLFKFPVPDVLEEIVKPREEEKPQQPDPKSDEDPKHDEPTDPEPNNIVVPDLNQQEDPKKDDSETSDPYELPDNLDSNYWNLRFLDGQCIWPACDEENFKDNAALLRKVLAEGDDYVLSSVGCDQLPKSMCEGAYASTWYRFEDGNKYLRETGWPQSALQVGHRLQVFVLQTCVVSENGCAFKDPNGAVPKLPSSALEVSTVTTETETHIETTTTTTVDDEIGDKETEPEPVEPNKKEQEDPVPSAPEPVLKKKPTAVETDDENSSDSGSEEDPDVPPSPPAPSPPADKETVIVSTIGKKRAREEDSEDVDTRPVQKRKLEPEDDESDSRQGKRSREEDGSDKPVVAEDATEPSSKKRSRDEADEEPELPSQKRKMNPDSESEVSPSSSKKRSRDAEHEEEDSNKRLKADIDSVPENIIGIASAEKYTHVKRKSKSKTNTQKQAEHVQHQIVASLEATVVAETKILKKEEETRISSTEPTIVQLIAEKLTKAEDMSWAKKLVPIFAEWHELEDKQIREEAQRRVHILIELPEIKIEMLTPILNQVSAVAAKHVRKSPTAKAIYGMSLEASIQRRAEIGESLKAWFNSKAQALSCTLYTIEEMVYKKWGDDKKVPEYLSHAPLSTVCGGLNANDVDEDFGSVAPEKTHLPDAICSGFGHWKGKLRWEHKDRDVVIGCGTMKVFDEHHKVIKEWDTTKWQNDFRVLHNKCFRFVEAMTVCFNQASAAEAWERLLEYGGERTDRVGILADGGAIEAVLSVRANKVTLIQTHNGLTRFNNHVKNIIRNVKVQGGCLFVPGSKPEQADDHLCLPDDHEKTELREITRAIARKPTFKPKSISELLSTRAAPLPPTIPALAVSVTPTTLKLSDIYRAGMRTQNPILFGQNFAMRHRAMSMPIMPLSFMKPVVVQDLCKDKVCGRGRCEKSTGQCVCFHGYTGDSCYEELFTDVSIVLKNSKNLPYAGYTARGFYMEVLFENSDAQSSRINGDRDNTWNEEIYLGRHSETNFIRRKDFLLTLYLDYPYYLDGYYGIMRWNGDMGHSKGEGYERFSVVDQCIDIDRDKCADEKLKPIKLSYDIIFKPVNGKFKRD